jgi:hypothetical protein
MLPIIPPTDIVRCPVVTQMIKQGAENPLRDVANLQTFLRVHEHMDVMATGDYDDETEAAVKEFQMRHADEILAPWGATKASGIVSLTTRKVMDKMACSKPLTLDGREMKFIEIVRAKAEKLEAMGLPMTAGVADALAAGVADQQPTAPAVVAYPYSENGKPGTTAGRFGEYLKGLFR